MHPARFPEELPEFLIRFLTREDDLVVDPMCGSARTARAADRLRRRWVCGDLACEYLRAAFRLTDLPGFVSHFGPRPEAAIRRAAWRERARVRTSPGRAG